MPTKAEVELAKAVLALIDHAKGTRNIYHALNRRGVNLVTLRETAGDYLAKSEVDDD